MINVEDLLKPITDDKPTGEDFTYHPSFQNLETIFRGKPETQFGPGEEPQWKEVQDAALDVLSNSKQLAAGVMLTVALMKTSGLEGLRDGFAVVRGMTERYWSDIYPRLDPDDNNDPTERLNILNNLSSNGEPYKFLPHLKQIVICDSSMMGRITFQQYSLAKEKTEKGATAGAKTGPDLNQIEAAFREAGPELARTTLTLVEEVIGHAQGMESFLDTILGSGQGVNFESLNKLLAEIKSAIEPYAGGDPAAVGGEVAEGAASPEDSAAGDAAGETRAPAKKAAGLSGAIQTRAEVIKALDLICAYYRDHEPSSPVPLILQRAQRLVDKDFMTIMTDLTPDSLKQIEVITGIKPKEES